MDVFLNQRQDEAPKPYEQGDQTTYEGDTTEESNAPLAVLMEILEAIFTGRPTDEQRIDRQAEELGQGVRLGSDTALSDRPYWEGYDPHTLKAMATEQADPGDVNAMGQSWNEQGNKLAEVAKTMNEALVGLQAAWDGQAASAAQNSAKAVADWGLEAAQTAQFMGNRIAAQAEAVQTAKNAMPDPVVYDPREYLDRMRTTSDIAEWFSIAAEARQQRDLAIKTKQRQVDVMNAYTAAMMEVDATTPRFVPPSDYFNADVAGPAQPSVPGGRPSLPQGLPGGPTGGDGSAPAHTAGATAVPGAPIGGPPALTAPTGPGSGVTPGIPGMPVFPGGPNTPAPGGTGTGGPRTPGVPGTGGPNSSAASTAGRLLPGGGGFGNTGFGNASGGGAGGGSGGTSGGSGATGDGVGRRPGPGFGADGGARGGLGVGGLADEAAPRGARAGYPAAGAMPVGAGAGRREEDEEHRRPSWLIEPDEDMFTDGTRVAPPVIGEYRPDHDR